MPILLSTQFSAIRVKPSAFVHMHIKWTYQTKRLPDVFFPSTKRYNNFRKELHSISFKHSTMSVVRFRCQWATTKNYFHKGKNANFVRKLWVLLFLAGQSKFRWGFYRKKKISHEYRKYRINIENIAQIVQKYRKISKISYRLEYKR